MTNLCGEPVEFALPAERQIAEGRRLLGNYTAAHPVRSQRLDRWQHRDLSLRHYR